MDINSNRLCRAMLLVAALFYIHAAGAQTCTGSLGAPILNETFGAGAPNPGSPLANGITNLEYVNNTCPNDGQYTIANYSAGCYSPNWHTLKDHTGDTNGYYMLINASEQPSDFFVQTVTGLCDGTTYQFSAWIVNMDSMSGILPNVTFTIETTGGTVLQSYSSGDIPLTDPAAWKQYGFYFTTSAGVDTVVLRMHNNAPGGDGNDLALDDIQFRPAGPETVVGTAIGKDTIVNVCTINQTVSFASTYTSNCYVNTAFQWQMSRDTVNWTDIPGATLATYNPPTQAPGVYYFRLEVAQAGNIGISSCSVFSNLIKVTYTNLTPIADTLQAAICNGQSYTLPSGKIVRATGVYEDTIYSTGGCDSVNTTIYLNVITAKTNTVNAATCPGAAYILPWGKSVSAAGLYADTVKSAIGCDSIITTVTLKIDNPPQANSSSSVCIDSSTTITAPTGFVSYLWNTGAATVSITAFAGVYTLKATDSIGCSTFDTFSISNSPPPVVTLNQDIVLCAGEPGTIDAGAGYQSYLWNTGSNSETISITTTGTYWVTVKDAQGCPGSDTTVVNTVANPPSDFLPEEVSKCSYNSLTLSAANAYAAYLWSTGSTASSIVVANAGKYWLTVTDNNGCIGTDTTTVQDSTCKEFVYVPSAFTPNGDGRNDVFRPVVYGLAVQYDFAVYNRWGQKVFESETPGVGWDGTVNSISAPSGTYVWELSITLSGYAQEKQKGTVELIR